MSFAAAWLGWVLDAFDFTIFLLVLPEIAAELGVSQTATAGTITLTLVFRLLGGFAAGALGDRYGRRLPLMISMVWLAVCDGAIAFAPSFFWVLVCRTLFGFGMGAEWTSGTTLAMENWPAKSRGIASGVLQGSWAVGYLLAGLVAAWVVPIWGWRALFLLAALPALLVLPIRWLVTESFVRPQPQSAVSIPRFVGPVLVRLCWASAFLLFGLAHYYALTAMYPTLLKTELGLGQAAVGTHVALFNVGMLVGAVACGVVAARRGPVIAVLVPALLMLPVLPLYAGVTRVDSHVGALLGGIFGAGFSGVTPLLLTSLFPAALRARGVGLAYHLGAFGSAFVAPLVSHLREGGGLPLSRAVMIVSGVSLVAMLGVLLVRPRATFGELP
jgi:MFS transporter, SHS family, lactate transporter